MIQGTVKGDSNSICKELEENEIIFLQENCRKIYKNINILDLYEEKIPKNTIHGAYLHGAKCKEYRKTKRKSYSRR